MCMCIYEERTVKMYMLTVLNCEKGIMNWSRSEEGF